MPKRPLRNKQTVRPGSAPKSVRDLMSVRLPAVAERALSRSGASEWHVAVLTALGPELSDKVNGSRFERGTLTVIAASAAWAAHMRFRLAESEVELRRALPGLREVAVQVRPLRPAKRRP
jgi:hypothetical protein